RRQHRAGGRHGLRGGRRRRRSLEVPVGQLGLRAGAAHHQRVRDVRLGGGAVEGLPAHTFKTEAGDVALKCPTETAITDRREKELSDLGFVTLCHCKGSDYAAFFGGQTTNKPKLYNTPQANANARVSSNLPYVLAASRFAHYFKSMMRDKVGSFMTRDNVA